LDLIPSTISGTSPVFEKYANTFCDVPRAFARSAAVAAINMQSFFNSLDNERSGQMSTGQLFQNLKLMVGEGGENEDVDSLAAEFTGLTDAQAPPNC
jgi:hypothetical protein